MLEVACNARDEQWQAKVDKKLCEPEDGSRAVHDFIVIHSGFFRLSQKSILDIACNYIKKL